MRISHSLLALQTIEIHAFAGVNDHAILLPTQNEDERKLQALKRANFDLKITNRAKEIVIERMQKERDGIIEKCWLQVGRWGNWKRSYNLKSGEI